MVIDTGNNLNPASGAASGSAKARATPTGRNAPAAEYSPAPAAQDSVSLSPQGQTLAKLSTELSQSPDVDQDKVAAVRTALAEGRYQVDAQAIAGKMLEQDDLLG
ncbi:flagellar biosynthesis anti-sigma factor FlgM [Teredinibacter turnerae]|uniref:flagellar biosynthesis anti-sigma factor FlgM n=1 Tax=Teredinibacter turnerae TaxID=2426 RepID=UPI0003808A5F|nr:flagellar biosynthesis anti-sigma factor FlgM [Teredinibacter turnerae]